MSELNERLQSIFRDILEDQDLTICDSATSDEVPGWDSFAQVKLIIAMEESFGVTFTMHEAVEIKSVAGFKNALAAKGVTAK